MLTGMYLNPKYARRQKRRRLFTLVFCSLLLAACCFTAIYRIDANIRSAMLPNAPPIAYLEQQHPQQYLVRLFGQEFYFSTGGVSALLTQLEQLLHTPPPVVRLAYQLRAYLTGELPRNSREDTRIPYIA